MLVKYKMLVTCILSACNVSVIVLSCIEVYICFQYVTDDISYNEVCVPKTYAFHSVDNCSRCSLPKCRVIHQLQDLCAFEVRYLYYTSIVLSYHES